MKSALLLSLALIAVSCQQDASESEMDSRTGEEAWTELFNGRDLSGWVPKIRGEPLGSDVRETFRVENDLLTVRYDAYDCLLYTSPSPRDKRQSRMPSSA